MEESNILNKNNKKKILVGSIIIVLVLLLVVVGSTYAYFSLQVNGEGTSTKVTITTGSSKQIKLSGGLEDFHIKLDVKDMAYNRIDREYYATSDSKLPYVTNKEAGLTEIGKVEVTGDLEERHVCTASAKVTLDGGMATLIQKGDLELYLESEQYTNKSDLKDISNSYPVTLTFILEDVETSHIINAYLKFTNRNIDQSYLAGQTLNVSIIIEDFKCTTDTKAPEVNNFYINKNEEENYTNQINNTAYITWEDEDVSEYCITDKEGSNNCTSWESVNGNEVQKQIELTDTEGEQIYYVYLKDKANNISTGNRYATIVYDKTAPSITNATSDNITQTGFRINITGNDTKEGVNRTSGIYQYCYSQSDSTNEGDYTCDSNSSITISGLQPGTSYTYYIYAKDKAGNSGITNRQQYTFATKAKPTSDYLKDHSIGGNEVKTLQDNPVDGMYRYKGTASQVTNNYICFGTTDSTVCKNQPDKYMYRIIGITSAADTTLGLKKDQLKIIKATPSANEQKWGSSANDSSPWDSSQAKSHVTTWYNTNVKGATPNGTYWDSIVTEQKWYNVDQTSSSITTTEPKGSQSAASKVALMYATDYANAGALDTTNWLHIKNGWSTNSTLSGDVYEWTMSRYGYSSGYVSYIAWFVHYYGNLNHSYVYNTFAVRPVFYLTPNITLTGEGTTTSPFIINS